MLAVTVLVVNVVAMDVDVVIGNVNVVIRVLLLFQSR